VPAEELHRIVRVLGGKVSEKLTKRCTHLIAANASSAKAQFAMTCGIPVVRREWLFDCAQLGSLQPPDAYVWSATASAPKSDSAEDKPTTAPPSEARAAVAPVEPVAERRTAQEEEKVSAPKRLAGLVTSALPLASCHVFVTETIEASQVQVLRRLGATLVKSAAVTGCTHVVVSSAEQASALPGVPPQVSIVLQGWVDACAATHSLVDAKPFLAPRSFSVETEGSSVSIALDRIANIGSKMTRSHVRVRPAHGGAMRDGV
jgi:hypothetical protein